MPVNWRNCSVNCAFWCTPVEAGLAQEWSVDAHIRVAGVRKTESRGCRHPRSHHSAFLNAPCLSRGESVDLGPTHAGSHFRNQAVPGLWLQPGLARLQSKPRRGVLLQLLL